MNLRRPDFIGMWRRLYESNLQAGRLRYTFAIFAGGMSALRIAAVPAALFQKQ